MALFDTHSELLHALHSMGVELPPRTKLSSENLDRKLRKGLDFSQGIRGADSLDILKLKEWSSVSSSSLFESVKTLSVAEAHQNFLAKARTGFIPTPELYVDPFMDLRQTLMGMGNAYDQNMPITLMKDKENEHSIVFRVSKVLALNDYTPLILVLYSTCPGPMELRNPRYFMAHKQSVQSCTATLQEQKLLLKILEGNEKRLAPGYKPEHLPFETDFKLSFLLPLHPLNMIAIGSLTSDIGCAICGDKTKAKCSQCHSMSYCGKECQRYDWPQHKKSCKALAKGTWMDICFHVPILADSFNRHDTFADIRTMGERVSQTSDLKPGRDHPQYRGKDDSGCGPPQPNIHGDNAFLIKLQVPLCAPDDPSASILMYDRRRSFDAYMLKEVEGNKYSVIEHVTRNNGINGLKIYRWAKRTGDWKLSICIDREPGVDLQW